MSLFGRLFHSSTKGDPPPPSTSTPAFAPPPDLAQTFSAFTTSDLTPAISFSVARLDSSSDPTQSLTDGDSLFSPKAPPSASAASFFPPSTSPALTPASAPPPVPASALSSTPLSDSPAPSPTSSALPPPTHRQSSSLTLPFSLLPPPHSPFSSSPFTAALAGEDDLPFISPDLDHLWLCYEEEKSNILAISALEAFARALLPTLPPPSSPPSPSHAGGHPARLLYRLKADFMGGWPEVRRAIGDAILGKRIFAPMVDYTVDPQMGGRGGQVRGGDVVGMCAGLGPSFLSLYLLYRLFAFPHNRRVLMRMEWCPFLVKISQLMASQYQASQHAGDGALNDTEESEVEEGVTGGVAPVVTSQSSESLKDGPLEEEAGGAAEGVVPRSRSGSSSRVAVIPPEGEQQLKELEWQRRKVELSERRRSVRRLHLYLESSLSICMTMCAAVVDPDDDWRSKSTKRSTVHHAPSTTSSTTSSAFTSPQNGPTSSIPSSLPQSSIPPITSPASRGAPEGYREGHGNRTTVFDDSGLVDVLTALLRVLVQFPIHSLSYSQMTLIRATLHAMGAVSFDNKKVQYLFIQQTALDDLCQTLRWERNSEPEPSSTTDNAVTGDNPPPLAGPMQSPSSFNRLTDRATVDAMFGPQEREENDSNGVTSSSCNVVGGPPLNRAVSAPVPGLHAKRPQISVRSVLSALSISLYHVQLLALQVVRELTCQQLPSCWDFMESTGLSSILHSVAWIINTFHQAIPTSSLYDTLSSIHSCNDSLTSQASSLIFSLAAQQGEVNAEDGQCLFSVPDFRMTSLSSTSYTPRVDATTTAWARNPWLAALFDGVLLSFLICPDVVVTQSSSFFAMFQSRAAMAAIDPYQFISYHILRLVMSLFDESQHAKDDQVVKARLLMKQTKVNPSSAQGVTSTLLLPSVQLHCLSLLREATTLKPSLIPYLRSHGICSLFYEPFFYFYLNPSAVATTTAVSGSVLSPVNGVVDLQRLLRVSVVDLLVHFMLGDPSGDLDAQVEEMRFLLSSYRFSLSTDELRVEGGRHATDMSQALIDLFSVRRHHAAVVLVALMDAALAEDASPASAPPSPAHLKRPFAGVQRSAFTLDTPVPQLWTLLLARQQALTRTATNESALTPLLWSAVLLLLEHVVFASQSMSVRLLRDDAFCLQLSELMRDADDAQRRAAMRMIIALMTSVGPPEDQPEALTPSSHTVPPSPKGKPVTLPTASHIHRRTRSSPHASFHPATSTVPPLTSVHPSDVLRVSDEQQRMKRLLLNRYLELIQSYYSIPQVEDWLAGLRKVVSVHSATHQDILRRRQALLHVTNVLVMVLRGEQSRVKEEGEEVQTGRASTSSPKSLYKASASVMSLSTSLPPLYRQSSSTIDAAMPSLRRDRSLVSPHPSTASLFPVTREGGGSEGSSAVPSNMPSPTLLPSSQRRPAPPPLQFSPVQSTPSPSPSFPRLTRDIGVRVCVSVVLTLTSLMSGNRRSMDLFRRFIGYDLLCELLVRCECGRPSRQVTVALLHLMVDGQFQLAGHDLRKGHSPPQEERDSDPSDSSTPGSVRFSTPSDLPSAIVSSFASPAASSQATPQPLPRSLATDAGKTSFTFSPYASSADGVPTTASVPPLSSGLTRILQGMPLLYDRFLIVNPEALTILFSRQRFLRCGRSHQGDLLSLFHSVISLSSLNAAFAAKVSLVDLLFDLFPYFPPLLHSQHDKDSITLRALALISLCGHYSISVKQLKRAIALLRSQTVHLQPHQLSTYSVHLHQPQPSSVPSSASSPTRSPPSEVAVQVRPFWSVALFEALEGMSAREGPDNYLWFDGVQGGLSLPPMQTFPTKGWSLSTWIRIESFTPPPPSASHVQCYSYSVNEVAPTAFIPTAVLNGLSPLARLTALSAHRTITSSPSSTPSSSAPSSRRGSTASSHHPRLFQLLTSCYQWLRCGYLLH